MTPKLYKAAEVCEIAQLQPYVLRSWEKEFPGIGVQRSDDSPRLYRQSDLDQVLRIRQLVFVEGLTLSGARRRIEQESPAPAVRQAQVSEVIEVLGADAHKRIAHVRDGLRSILHLLDGRADDYALTPPAPAAGARKVVPARSSKPVVAARKAVPTRGKPTAKRAAR
jgi:DNA-binding transcriptional MerR regulator